jgi:hypothetical protein
LLGHRNDGWAAFTRRAALGNVFFDHDALGTYNAVFFNHRVGRNSQRQQGNGNSDRAGDGAIQGGS